MPTLDEMRRMFAARAESQPETALPTDTPDDPDHRPSFAFGAFLVARGTRRNLKGYAIELVPSNNTWAVNTGWGSIDIEPRSDSLALLQQQVRRFGTGMSSQSDSLDEAIKEVEHIVEKKVLRSDNPYRIVLWGCDDSHADGDAALLDELARRLQNTFGAPAGVRT